MRYQWLLLDADGTLFDFDRAEVQALEAALLETGWPFQPAHGEAYRQINARIWRAFEQGQVTQAQLRVGRFEELFAAIGATLDAERFSARYLRYLADNADLVEGAEETVRALYGKVGMVILTNGIAAVQRQRFARSAVRAYISDLVISEEVGAAKPDPRIFDAAFECMGRPAKQAVLMVGDSLTSDVQGGNAYGIDTCWFNPDGRPRPPEVPVRYEIGRLDELLEIVR